MSFKWLNDFKEKLDLFYMERPRFVPDFLNSKEKWDNVLFETDTVVKFEQVVMKILEDERVDVLDFYCLVKALGDSIDLIHEKIGIKKLTDVVDSMMKYIYYYKTEKEEDTCSLADLL